MREFLESLFDKDQQIDLNYSKYDTLFVKKNYNAYYLFFFIQKEEELLVLKNDVVNLYQIIKNCRGYELHMDKNVTCIYCLCVEDEKYYSTESTGTISELSKIICLVEEDLNYFKKNVLLYTDEMNQFASENIGNFDLLCQERITESNFQAYKISNRENYEYDFLINLFIKLPFLNFQKYQKKDSENYNSVDSFIDKKCENENISRDNIRSDMIQLEEKLMDENKLYEWIDELLKKNDLEKNISCEVTNDEN